MESKFFFVGKDGYTSLEATKNDDGSLYLESTSSHWDGDSIVLLHIPLKDVKELKEWLSVS